MGGEGTACSGTSSRTGLPENRGRSKLGGRGGQEEEEFGLFPEGDGATEGFWTRGDRATLKSCGERFERK